MRHKPCTSAKVLKRLRGVAADLADLQQDVYDEDWQNLAIYPNLFQAYLPATWLRETTAWWFQMIFYDFLMFNMFQYVSSTFGMTLSK